MTIINLHRFASNPGVLTWVSVDSGRLVSNIVDFSRLVSSTVKDNNAGVFTSTLGIPGFVVVVAYKTVKCLGLHSRPEGNKKLGHYRG